MTDEAAAPPAPGPTAAADLDAMPRQQQLVSDPLVDLLSIHRAMRLELQAICDALTAAKADDELSAAATRLERYATVFRAHAKAEDELLLPALALREAQLGRVAEEDDAGSHDGDAHDDETRKLENTLSAVARAVVAPPGARRERTEAAAATLDDFREFMANHMLEEEESVLPRLRRVFSRDELLQLTGAVLGRRRADDTVSTLEIVVPNLEPAQARHVLATMSAVANGSKFRGWLGTLSRLAGASAGPAGPCVYCAPKKPAPKKRRTGAKGQSPAAPAGPTYHCPYCNVCRPGRGLGIDAFHCMRCNKCVPAPHGRACSRNPPFLHVCGETPPPYEVADPACAPAPDWQDAAAAFAGGQKRDARVVAAACARCGKCVFAALELLDALPCGHVVHARCLRPALDGTPPPPCGVCGAPAAPPAGAGADTSPLDLLAGVISAAATTR